MKARGGRGTAIGGAREFCFGAGLLALYALALYLSDPEWAMWAGGMAVGALPAMDTPPVLAIVPRELFAGAGGLSMLGLGAFVGFGTFLGIRSETSHGTPFHGALPWIQKERRGGEHDGRNHPGT